MDRVIAGRYRLLSPLTTVEEGTLWRAQDELLRRDVAIREVPVTDDVRTQARRHAVSEGVFDVVAEDDHVFVVTALLAPPAPAPEAARRPRRAPLVAGAMVVALAGASGWFASTRPTDPGTGTAVRPPSPTGAPATWATYTGAGWTLRHPPGWQVGTFRGQLQLRDPVTRRTVRVGQGALPDPEAFAASHTGYQELDRTPSRWEFTYSDGGADLHVVDHLLAHRGRSYTVFTQTRAADWEAARTELEKVVASMSIV